MSLRQDIESRIAILDIVNRYTQTKKAGANYKALCPFHQEKTPSFVISPAKNIAKCFGCGKGGGPINFLIEVEQIEYREAVKILAKEAGIELKGFSGKSTPPEKDPYLAHKIATQWYHENLLGEEGKKALSYLTDRGLSMETIKNFKLGFSSAPRDLLYTLKSKNFDVDFLRECGIFVSGSRDKFFGRIVFPIANMMGNTVGFTGRILGKGEPKYLNSPASKIFDKSQILYGLHLAKQEIIKTGEAYIVEGQMDTISLHQAGLVNSVGISGTALTKDHIRILKRFTQVVYLMLDSDDAGVNATFASIENLLNQDIEIKIIQIPNGKDPDDFIQSGGDVSLLKKTAINVVDFYLQMGQKKYDTSTIIGKKQLVETCLSLIKQIKSEVEVDMYLQHISASLHISLDVLYSAYKKAKAPVVESEKTEEISEFVPTIFDIFAASIWKYNFFDLFFEKFAYTMEELSSLEGVGLLIRVLSEDFLDDDIEKLDTIVLYLEEKNPSISKQVQEKNTLDILQRIHGILLAKEFANKPANAPIEIFIKKAKSLGLPPSVLKNTPTS
ncbi:DNA primase [Candidatus Gracilibacteria bacterium]|nr:DNA primase [Candidatus Gracilibacteria bacterium]